MRNVLDLLASVSRLAIAAAIVYFGYQLAQINANVGDVTQTVDGVSRQIPPTLEEVRAIRLEVAAVSERIPAILAEVEAVRKEIPGVTAQVEAVNGQIGPILQRVDRSLDEMAELQRQMPQILHSADSAIAALNQTRDEVVPLVPQALEEVRLTREKIDPTLDRVESLVDDAFVKADRAIAEASQAGQKASEGAVKGFFTGLVKLPFQLVGTLASPLVETMDEDVAKQMNEQDLKLMTEAGTRAAEPGRRGEETPWSNPKSGNSGSITIIRSFTLAEHDCVEARVKISNIRKQIQNKVEEFCRGEDGVWIQAAKVGEQTR